MLMRVFLGWLRGERRHCSMVAIPTLEEEDAKRPSRERESLVGEGTRIINRMKATLARLGIRGFKPDLRQAPQRLDALRTPEGVPVPPNTCDETRRAMARLAWIREQISAIELARVKRLEQAPAQGPDAMVRLLARVIGVGLETADMLVRRCCPATCGIDGRSRAMPGSRDRPTRAAPSAGRGGWRRRETLACAVA
jgi:transposase